jgi:hypothetical protein
MTPSAVVVGASPGSPPEVQVLDESGNIVQEFLAFQARFRGGVNVALGDVTGDGTPDIIASMATRGGRVNVFDGVTYQLVTGFFPYGARFAGGVNLAYGQLHEGSIGSIITGAEHGLGVVKVFDAATLEQTLRLVPYSRHVNGVRVAVANLDGGYFSDIVMAPGPGGEPVIKSFDATTGELSDQIMAYDSRFRGGVEIASGDFDNNLVPDIVTVPGRGIAPLVKIFASGAGNPLISQFIAPVGTRAGGVLVGALHTSGPEPDAIVVAPARASGRSNQASREIEVVDTTGAPISKALVAGLGAGSLGVSSVLETSFTSYQGEKYHGVVYSPTWPNWAPTGGTQLEDSDFGNIAFQGLWGIDTNTNQGRNDLGTFQSAGFNLVRLYNWGPERGWNGTRGIAHLPFLDQALADNEKVIVPVSNFFLSDKFAWEGQNPDANYSFGSAPKAIQDDLMNFISSITTLDGTKIHPAVAVISVGNEIDLGVTINGPDPGITSKLERALWWIVNLHDQIATKFPNSGNPFLTIPVANSDQDNRSVTKQSWFQIFLHGAKQGGITPFGTVGGDTFTADVAGLQNYSWYNDWFVNSVNMTQTGSHLKNTITQYDTGVPTGPNWNDQWPGEKFDVPLLLTEEGISRFNRGDALQSDIVADQQVQIIEDFMKTSHNFLGYAVFQSNDEPNKNGYNLPPPNSETLFGITKYYNTQDQNDFRNGNVLFHLHTGETLLFPNPGHSSFPDLIYPVYQLYPVGTSGPSLMDRIKKIIAGG